MDVERVVERPQQWNIIVTEWTGTLMGIISDRYWKKGMLNRCIIILLLLLSATQVRAERLFAVAPIFSPEETEVIFRPLMAKMAEALDEKVTLYIPRGWIDFRTELFKDQFDIILNPPHLAAWASVTNNRSFTANLDNQLLVQLSGEQTFYYLAPADSKLAALKDLRNRRICSRPSPGMGAMTIYTTFTDPVIQPSLVETKGRGDALLSKLQKGRCHAMVVDERDYRWLSDSGKLEQLKVLHQTNSYPNDAISISERLRPAQRQALKAMFLNAAQDPDFSGLLHHYVGSQVEEPVLARYEGMETMLDAIWGW